MKGILSEQPNVSGLIKAGKIAHGTFTSSEQPTSIIGTDEPSSPIIITVPEVPRSDPIPIPASRRKLNVYKAIEEEFANSPQGGRQYLRKLRKMETIPESDTESH